LQHNKRSTGQNDPKSASRKPEAADDTGKNTNLTTGRLINKVGGQEHEVERNFGADKHMGMTMQAFKT